MMRHEKLWMSDPTFLKGQNGLTSCIFFHEWNEWKIMQRVRPFGLEKRSDLTFIGFECLKSFTSISNKCGTWMSLIFQGFMKSIWPLIFGLFMAFTAFITITPICRQCRSRSNLRPAKSISKIGIGSTSFVELYSYNRDLLKAIRGLFCRIFNPLNPNWHI